ncbi:MAG: hypothetical protein WCJ58_09040 [bacterium]
MKSEFERFYHRRTPSGLIKERKITSSTILILQEAKKLNIKIETILCTRIFKLTWKNKVRFFYYQNPGNTSALSIYCSSNKRITRELLTQNGISVPKGYDIHPNDDLDYWKEIFESLKTPLVVKPNIGTQGKAIAVNIESFIDYATAVKNAFAYSNDKENWVIVEEMLRMKEYRILVSQKKIIGVLNRVPANVIGDGKSNIRKLINIKNSDPRRGDPVDHPPLFRIELDEMMKTFLLIQGLTWKSIPPKNKQIFLRGVSNISQGGDSIDYTDKIHPSVGIIALQAINSIPGLVLGGVDFMTKDITKKQTKNSYAILEINDSPGIDMHDFPFEGKNRHAAIAFLKIMFDEF